MCIFLRKQVIPISQGVRFIVIMAKVPKLRLARVLSQTFHATQERSMSLEGGAGPLGGI